MANGMTDTYQAEIVEPFEAEAPQPPGGKGTKGCLIGCLILLLVGVCICGGLAWIAYRRVGELKTWATDQARDAMVEGIQNSDLPEEEKQAITAQVDRVVGKYKSGEIATEDLFEILQELAESPVMAAVIVLSVEAGYLEPSGLSDEEKDQGCRILQRVLRGVTQEEIHPNDLEPAFDMITEKKSGNQRELKQKLTDDEVRALLAELKRIADEEEIPDEPFRVNMAEEFRKAIDRALERTE